MSIYAKIPVGYSLLAVSGFGAGGVAHGMNFGVIPGATFNLTERFGTFGELGLIHPILLFSRRYGTITYWFGQFWYRL